MFQKLRDFYRVRKLRKLCKPGEFVRQGYWRDGGVKHKGNQIWVRSTIMSKPAVIAKPGTDVEKFERGYGVKVVVTDE